MPTTNRLTIDVVECWNTNKLLEWIQQNLNNPLDDDDKEVFLKAKIDGEAFLGLAGDKESFRSVNLPLGSSQKLARLAKNLAELVKDTTSRKCKYCPLHHTLHATAS
jgi:hypothetical protein